MTEHSTNDATALVKRCKALNKQGEPCAAVTVQANGWCRMHDPALVEVIAAERSAGGKKMKQTWHDVALAKVERNASRWFKPYESALEAKRVVVDQRTAQVLETELPDHETRMKASERVLDRVYGRPTQRNEVTGQLNLAALMADSPQALTDSE